MNNDFSAPQMRMLRCGYANEKELNRKNLYMHSPSTKRGLILIHTAGEIIQANTNNGELLVIQYHIQRSTTKAISRNEKLSIYYLYRFSVLIITSS